VPEQALVREQALVPERALALAPERALALLAVSPVSVQQQRVLP